jgi:hypothetical protein
MNNFLVLGQPLLPKQWFSSTTRGRTFRLLFFNLTCTSRSPALWFRPIFGGGYSLYIKTALFGSIADTESEVELFFQYLFR